MFLQITMYRKHKIRVTTTKFSTLTWQTLFLKSVFSTHAYAEDCSTSSPRLHIVFPVQTGNCPNHLSVFPPGQAAQHEKQCATKYEKKIAKSTIIYRSQRNNTLREIRKKHKAEFTCKLHFRRFPAFPPAKALNRGLARQNTAIYTEFFFKQTSTSFDCVHSLKWSEGIVYQWKHKVK